MSIFHISIPVSGLIRGEDYAYEIIGLGGNWPSIASPASGSFTSKSKSTSINTTISFLPTTGSVSSLNVLPYSLLSTDHEGYQDKDIFTRVAARVTNTWDNCAIVSDSKLIDCSGCFPNPRVSITGCGPTVCDQYSLTGTHIFDFISSFSGLEPDTSYQYNIRSIGSNWPTIMISPLSGSFFSNSKTYNLRHKLAFCPYSGNLCGSDNTLSYDPAKLFNKNNLYTNIELSVAPDYSLDKKTFSNSLFVNCDNCLPKIVSALPSKILLTSSNITNISGAFSGLVPNTLYYYSFECIDSNWPSILKPVSGNFIAGSGTDNIVSQLMFCYPSGDCTYETEGFLPYSLDSSADKAFNQKKLHTDLRLKLTSEYGEIATSRKCSIECQECLPCIRYASIMFDQSPAITLDSACCAGQKLLRVNVSSSMPGERYTYKFSSLNGAGGVNSISFNPSSGEIYFGSGGMGTINTICNVDLMDNAQTLIDCELTHTNTNNKVMDTIALSCNSDNC